MSTPNGVSLGLRRINFELMNKEEKGEMWCNTKKCLTKMNKDGRDRVGVKMHQLDLLKVKNTVKKIASQKSKTSKKVRTKGRDLFLVGHWNGIT